ncbi:MAG: AAA family ATPase [Holophagales bacterium]|nr:AAA family ATPase [Holophagales bacterium]
MFAPLKEQKVLSPDEFQKLPQEERERLESEVERLKGEVEKILVRVPGWMRERRERQEALERDLAERTVAPLFADRRERYAGLQPVLDYLAEVERDAVARARQIAALAGAEGTEGLAKEELPPLKSYRVNVLVSREASAGAPMVEEDHPTLANLVGRVEHYARQGALFTDFTLVKPGALHRADGGYLVLDAAQVLRQPFAWEALKRALKSRELKIESAAEAMSLTSTVTLEPEPAPLDVKVVLIGDPSLYYLLARYEPEFQELFKIGADFAHRLERTPEAVRDHARLLAGMAARDGLRPLAAGAAARLLEHGARLAGDAASLSLDLGALSDVLEEADHLAAAAEKTEIDRDAVEAALAARVRRADRLREEIQREIGRGTIRIETSGERVGQVNGLAVVELDSFRFGHPSRITARARLGDGKVVDIEREVELGGPLHSKGVLILAGFVGERYAPSLPLSLQATLVFEQSYGGVDGDSASLAELCVLLSAAGGVPIRQSLAVTGSVDQHGIAQAIGGVNEKIEGYFDVCAKRGLSGDQGVLIPTSNVPHLMLRADVVEAVAAGRFHVWAVADVDQALTLLTGRPAGERDDEGRFPEGSVNGDVETRLVAFALQRIALQKGETLGEVESSGGEGGEEEGADGSAEGSAPEEAR